jgi:V/A-type H+-transporting ATPase subunit I
MRRVAVVAPEGRADTVLRAVAARGAFEPDPRPGSADGDDATVDAVLGSAQHHPPAVIVPGWVRERDVDELRSAIAPIGGGVVDLPGRRGLVPPTDYAENRAGQAFRPLVTTYTTVPYVDVDPTLFAAAAYVVMFGMMFGDVGHGAAIVVLGFAALVAKGGRLARLGSVAWFLVAAGAAATLFGFLYGEAFGPTGLVPTLWLRPLDEPETFLVAGLVLGLTLLGVTFLLAIVNRWREGGAAVAIYEPSGVAGALVLIAVAAAVMGAATSSALWWWTSAGLAALGTVLVFVGLVVRSGASAAGLAQAVVEVFDTLLRLGSNIVSFTRLAAFGLTHAVITEVVWDGTTDLWDRSGPAAAAGVVLFVVGNVVAFGLGALVGAIQALRLEYYELFSRLFTTSGRPFRPWNLSDVGPDDARIELSEPVERVSS